MGITIRNKLSLDNGYDGSLSNSFQHQVIKSMACTVMTKITSS